MSRASFKLYSEKLELLRGSASDDESEKCRDMDPDRIEGSSKGLARRIKCPGEVVLPLPLALVLPPPWPRLTPELAASPGLADDAVEAWRPSSGIAAAGMARLCTFVRDDSGGPLGGKQGGRGLDRSWEKWWVVCAGSPQRPYVNRNSSSSEVATFSGHPSALQRPSPATD